MGNFLVLDKLEWLLFWDLSLNFWNLFFWVLVMSVRFVRCFSNRFYSVYCKVSFYCRVIWFYVFDVVLSFFGFVYSRKDYWCFEERFFLFIL